MSQKLQCYSPVLLLWLLTHCHGQAASAPRVVDVQEVIARIQQKNDEDVRYLAIMELESLGTKARAAVPALEYLIRNDQSLPLRYAAAQALTKLAGKNNRTSSLFMKQFAKDQSLIEAAWKGKLARVDKMIASGANLESQYLDLNGFVSDGLSDHTALVAATINGHTNIVKLLLTKGAALSLV